MTVLHHPPRSGSASPSPSLTERYLDVVAHGVPRQRRDVVTARVRATIESDVGRRVTEGVPPVAAEWQSIAELGDPKRVADAEAGPRWLVGPRLYPDYGRCCAPSR
ncbi:MAG: hypothetical protein WCA29_14655 [Jiangellales bacterium]